MQLCFFNHRLETVRRCEAKSEVVDTTRHSVAVAPFEGKHIVFAGPKHLDRVLVAEVLAYPEKRLIEGQGPFRIFDGKADMGEAIRLDPLGF